MVAPGGTGKSAQKASISVENKAPNRQINASFEAFYGFMSMRVWGDGPGEDVPGLTGRRKLAELAARVSGRLSIGVAAVATAILLGLLGVAAFTLPGQCPADPARPGQCLAPAAAAAQTTNPTSPNSPAGTAKAPVSAVPASAPVAQAQPAATRTGSLISATFDQLPVASVPAASDTAAPASAVPGAPTTRMVSTTIVHADATPPSEAPMSTQGMQIFEQAPDPAPAVAPVAVADPAPAATPAQPVVANAAAPVATVAPVVPQADPVLPASPPKRPAAPAATGGGMVVDSGSGVTVRSSPGGAQLFALARGQKVTVTGKQRGWLQIVDAQGRRGWAYSSFFGAR